MRVGGDAIEPQSGREKGRIKERERGGGRERQTERKIVLQIW